MSSRRSADFEGLLRALDARAIRSIVIGGVSAALQGVPAVTYDLDLVLDPAPAVLAAEVSPGAGSASRLASMPPRYAFALAALLLGACASSTERLERTWTHFEQQQDACLERAESVVPLYAEEMRARGDEEEVVRVVMPQGSPVALLADIRCAASLAYLDADVAGLERACAALERCERYLDALESRIRR